MVRKVVGIEYDADVGAPKVTVKAVGKAAESIIEERRATDDKRLVENKELLDALFSVPLDDIVDDSLFEVIAILLVHIYDLNSFLKGNNAT